MIGEILDEVNLNGIVDYKTRNANSLVPYGQIPKTWKQSDLISRGMCSSRRCTLSRTQKWSPKTLLKRLLATGLIVEDA